jgi:hypothetical protein
VQGSHAQQNDQKQGERKGLVCKGEGGTYDYGDNGRGQEGSSQGPYIPIHYLKNPPNPKAFGSIRNLYPMILEQILRLLAHTVFSI